MEYFRLQKMFLSLSVWLLFFRECIDLQLNYFKELET